MSDDNVVDVQGLIAKAIAQASSALTDYFSGKVRALETRVAALEAAGPGVASLETTPVPSYPATVGPTAQGHMLAPDGTPPAGQVISVDDQGGTVSVAPEPGPTIPEGASVVATDEQGGTVVQLPANAAPLQPVEGSVVATDEQGGTVTQLS